MVDQVVISVLAFLHILSALSWLGAIIFFLSIVAPYVRTLPPAASLEFLAKVGPRQIRYFVTTASATIVFGLALLAAYFGTDYTRWPSTIIVGFSLGLVAYLDAMLVAVPAFGKADKIAHSMLSNPQSGPPPPELAQSIKRGTLGVVSTAVILLITLAFMVGAAFPY